MNIDKFPIRPMSQAKPEKAPKPIGTGLAQEMLVNIVLGGDSQDTSRLLRQTVAQSVVERMKFLKPYLDALKEPPYSLEINDPNSPGWTMLSQKILEVLANKQEWKDLLAQAKEAVAESKKPIGEEYGFELYGMIAGASTEVIRNYAERRQKKPRMAA